MTQSREMSWMSKIFNFFNFYTTFWQLTNATFWSTPTLLESNIYSYEQCIKSENNINVKQRNLNFFFANISKAISCHIYKPGSLYYAIFWFTTIFHKWHFHHKINLFLTTHNSRVHQSMTVSIPNVSNPGWTIDQTH